MKKSKRTAIILITVAILIAMVPLFALKGASFGGSDDAGSVMINQITGGYDPWFTPVVEQMIHGELPGEIESLFFCIQTGIGVGIIAFIMGRLVERKKLTSGKSKESKL
jgi:cobalt/nickel transport protein